MKPAGGNKDREINVDLTTFALYRVMRARVMCLYEVCCGAPAHSLVVGNFRFGSNFK